MESVGGSSRSHSAPHAKLETMDLRLCDDKQEGAQFRDQQSTEYGSAFLLVRIKSTML